MDLRRIRYFVAVAEELHFGRAAEKVNVVQSAVSRQIKLLEEELGFTLFTRIGQKVGLTIPGEIFLPEACAILQRADEGLERVRASSRGTVGRLKIGFVDVALWATLPAILREYRNQAPSIDLQLRQLDRISQIEALDTSVIDLAIIPSPAPLDGDICTEPLAATTFVAVLPQHHHLAGRREIALGELASEPFVLFPTRLRTRMLEIIVAACSAAGFMPRVTQEAEQLHTLISLVNAGLGVTLAPKWITKYFSSSASYVNLVDPMPDYELLIAWRKSATSSNVAINQFRRVVATATAMTEAPLARCWVEHAIA
ncbi:LysR substrate-binding domain-containing protein [Paraburkholderia silviterrae]|uniref:LysR family transcriptional regulator n=1 Tax=Paraburkholderia silviterrae TaxID=2528715 RepID=A0A4R5MGF2_9BURK|nr:LysR substrate-binding domain-containing protein [Paraburkholderia silviterrae]TDG25966.1 LysR family transcriptional regulator [Paraburkholderia silviterrae]